MMTNEQPKPDTPDQGLQRAARAFFPGLTVCGTVPNAPHLAQVRTDGEPGDGAFLVRRWPEGTASARIDVTVAALGLAHERDVTTVPRMIPLPDSEDRFALLRDGQLYSASSWLQGRPVSRYGGFRDPDDLTIDVPLPPSVAAEDVLLDAVRTVGRFHDASRSLASDARLPAGTLGTMLSASADTWAIQRRIIGHHAASFPEIRRWLRCGNRVIPVAEERLAAFGTRDDRSVVIHGDLWPIHMLMDEGASGRELTGVVGWSKVLGGSPMIDLAHLAVHASAWSAATAESILGAYTEVAPLSPEERRILPVVAALDLVGRVGSLLHGAFVDEREIEGEALPVLRSGLKTLLVSLENLTQVLAPEAERDKRRTGPTPTGGRIWDRSRPAPVRSRRGAPRSGSDRSRPGSRPGTPRSR
ncbi:MAG: aminoglycoside phosphotransferase family protein [Chloroflexota bacterium]|nr:aminoglycoside phosphotransferase family protein [Chloroflexota bacterium]